MKAAKRAVHIQQRVGGRGGMHGNNVQPSQYTRPTIKRNRCVNCGVIFDKLVVYTSCEFGPAHVLRPWNGELPAQQTLKEHNIITRLRMKGIVTQ